MEFVLFSIHIVWKENLWNSLFFSQHWIIPYSIFSFPLPYTFPLVKYFDPCPILKYYSSWLKSQVQSLVLDF